MPAAKGTSPWNAGTSQGWTDKRGYRWVYVTENGKRRARREHRVIMEHHLGRRLEPWELVHHKDGNTANNDIANLELTDFGKHTDEHHKGSRRDEDAKRSMQAFALMREELSHERQIKSELLEALKPFADYCAEVEAFIDARAKDGASPIMPTNKFRLADFQRARAAIASATGAQP